MGKRPYTKRAKKTPLDAAGLSLLGTALYLGELYSIREARLGISRLKELQAQGLTVDQIDDKLDDEGLCHYDVDYIPAITPEMQWARNQVKALGLDGYTLQDAKTVEVKHFQFEWFHLFNNQELALFLKDLGRGPCAYYYASDFPISEYGGSELSGHLWRLLFDELALLAEGNFTLKRSPRAGEEARYSLLTYDLCGGGRPVGRPKDSGYNDDTALAVHMALEAMENRGKSARAATLEVIRELGTTCPSEDGWPVSGLAASDNGSEEQVFDRVYRLIRARAKQNRNQC